MIYKPVTSGFLPKMSVTVKQADKQVTIQQLAAQLRSLYSKTFGQIYPSFHLISDGYTTLAGSPSFEYTATLILGSPPVNFRTHQIYVIHGGMAYIFSYMTTDAEYAKLQPAFAAMLKSVRWIK